MINVSRVMPYTPKISFRAENNGMYGNTYISEPDYLDLSSPAPKKRKKINISVPQILAIASSGIIIAYFGMILHKEIAAKRAEKKIMNLLKAQGEEAGNDITEAMKNCKNEQIKRAVAEEYAKGPMMMSNKKLQALTDLSRIPEDEIKSIDIKKAKEILENEVIGMDEIKTQVIEFLQYRNKCIESGIKPDKPLVLSLDGPPGTAKTTLAQAIAKATGLPHKEINMAGATGKSKIIGNESVYTGASWGEIADAQLEHKTRNVVYTLDELEKTGTSDHNGKVEDTLLPLLDGRHKIKDDFLGVDIDISDSIVIITTNDFERLSEPLRDRISYKFKIAPYSKETKAKIAKFKFDKSLQYHNIADRVTIKPEVYQYIADNVTDQGGREVSENVQNVAHKIFVLSKEQDGNINISKDMVKNWLNGSKNAA